MHRRHFLATVGGAATASGSQPPAPKSKFRFYTLDYFYLKNGTQLGRIHEFLSKAWLPAIGPLHAGPKIVLEALVAPHMPQVVVLCGYESFEQIERMRSKAFAKPEFKKAFEDWEAGEEAPYEQMTSVLLELAAYSPEVDTSAAPPKNPRVFELRVYHSPTVRQLRALHERFAGPEIRIFQRVGVRPILYTSTYFGPHSPNLTYLIPFDDLAAREKAWSAFAADPEWIKVRKESIDKHGQISSVIQIALYRAAPYSPIR